MLRCFICSKIASWTIWSECAEMSVLSSVVVREKWMGTVKVDDEIYKMSSIDLNLIKHCGKFYKNLQDLRENSTVKTFLSVRC